MRGGEFVRAVLQKPGEQQIARLEQGEIFLVLDFCRRQQPGSFEVKQGRRHDEKLRSLTQIPRGPRGANMRDEVVGDLAERNFGDIHLVLGDQREQQVERPLEVV